MSGAWPWLAVAGLGALHGLNPAGGWMLAAASGVRAGSVAPVRRALLPIAIGHLASIAVVAFAVSQGLWPERAYVRATVAVLLGIAALVRWRRGGPCMAVAARGGRAGMVLGSFLTSSVHGTGLMLVPALVPLCGSEMPAREIVATGSLALIGAALAVHLAATLMTTAVVATGVCGGIARFVRKRTPSL
ncbi:MAG TPA: hypothetical protein VMU47_09050 [Caldimonas sp.]|nr:hypothetical protein [Caldimonas sp.]